MYFIPLIYSTQSRETSVQPVSICLALVSFKDVVMFSILAKLLFQKLFVDMNVKHYCALTTNSSQFWLSFGCQF